MEKPEDIRKRALGFYSSLYTCEFQENSNLAQEFYNGLPKVPDKLNVDLEQPLTLPELYSAVMSLANGKSPCIDGIPIEFYKTFWSILRPDLLVVLNESLAGGHLPLSCRRAVLTLLPKKGDLRDIGNWRPCRFTLC